MLARLDRLRVCWRKSSVVQSSTATPTTGQVSRLIAAHRRSVSWRGNRRLAQDLALFTQVPVLAAQPAEFVTLGRGEAIVAAAGIQVDALDPSRTAVSVRSSSLATWPTVLPVERTSSTTSALYSGGRTGVVVASDSISRAKLSLGCPPTRVNSRLELAGTVGNCGGCDGRPRLSLVGRAVLQIRGGVRPS